MTNTPATAKPPSPRAQVSLKSCNKLKSMVIHFPPLKTTCDLKHFAQKLSKKDKHRARAQARRIIGYYVDTWKLIMHIVAMIDLDEDLDAITIENAFMTVFLKFVYGDDAIIAAVGERHIVSEGELFVKRGDEKWLLNEDFFKDHGLDLDVLEDKVRECLENPDKVFPEWIRNEGWGDVLWLYDGPQLNGKPDWSKISDGDKLREEYVEHPEPAPKPMMKRKIEGGADRKDGKKKQKKKEEAAELTNALASPEVDEDTKPLRPGSDSDSDGSEDLVYGENAPEKDGDTKTVDALAGNDENKDEEEISSQDTENLAHPVPAPDTAPDSMSEEEIDIHSKTLAFGALHANALLDGCLGDISTLTKRLGSALPHAKPRDLHEIVVRAILSACTLPSTQDVMAQKRDNTTTQEFSLSSGNSLQLTQNPSSHRDEEWLSFVNWDAGAPTKIVSK